MTLPRLYVDTTLTVGQEVALPAAAAHHVRTVLRLARDADLVLFDGHGAAHEARLTQVGRDGAHALIGAALATNSESPLAVTLVQSISRGERMDYTLQKAVELGVQHIVAVTSLRTVVRLDPKRADKRLEHWRGIVQHAAEQSGRTILPTVSGVTTLGDWARTASGTRFLLQPTASVPLARQPRPAAAVTLVAGPEGGFDTREVDQLIAAGVTAVALGPRILRTETAAVCALAVMQALWGDLA